LAIILLASVTVGIVATAYYGISTLTKETTGETGKTIEHEFGVMGAKLKVDVFADCKIYMSVEKSSTW